MAGDKQENYESIKNQLNDFISELSNKKSYVLIDAYSEEEKPYLDKNEENAFNIIVKSDSFKTAIENAKVKLGIDSGDDHDFMFLDKESALNTLLQVVAAARALADPYAENLELSDEEYEKLVAEKGEDVWWVYAGIGEERTKLLKKEIENTVDEVLKISGMPKTWFQYVASCLLGTDYFNFHIKVGGEHSERLKVVNIERDFVDLRIYKGTKKQEYCECWKAIEDYIKHNVPAGLVRVEDQNSKIYNDKVNGVDNSKLRAEYHRTHSAQTKEEITINTHKVIQSRKKYKKIKT